MHEVEMILHAIETKLMVSGHLRSYTICMQLAMEMVYLHDTPASSFL